MTVSAILTLVLAFYITQYFVNCQISFDAANTVIDKAVCSRKCNGNNEENNEGPFPRYHCSCSRSCKIYGDCCYDSEYQNTDLTNKHDFICLFINGRGPVQAVSGCPPGRLSDFCKSAISHLPPVTSKVTNTTYANVFCAQCNADDENLVIWNVELRCCPKPGETTGSSLSNSTRIFMRKNYLWSRNDDGSGDCPCNYHVHFGKYDLLDSLELRFCGNQERISKCPYSWSDSETERKCWSYEDPVYFGKNVFRNLHCAECNYRRLNNFQCMPSSVQTLLSLGYNDTSIIYFCNKQGVDSCIQYFTGMNKGRPFVLSDMSRSPPVSTKGCVPPPREKCCDGENYDYRSKRCRKVKRVRNTK